MNMEKIISDGFKEIGNGNYLWRYDQFPDNFRGGIKFYANPSSILAFTSINPEDLNLAKEELEINVGHSSEKYNVNSVVHQDTGASIEVETGTEDPQSKIAQNEINEENSGDVIEVKTGLDNEDPIIEIETGTE